MKKEYDFSDAERGKFHFSEARLHLPVYLDEDNLSFLAERAASKGVELGRLVNDLLKRDIELIKAVQ